MEEDKIKEIFKQFNPKLTCGDKEFISKIQSNMDAVEEVKSRIVKTQKIYRSAAIMASLAGFISGMIFSMLLRIILPIIHRFSVAFLSENSIEIFGWCIVALIAILFTTFSYRLAIHHHQ